MKYKRPLRGKISAWLYSFIGSPIEQCLYIVGDYDPQTDRNRPARLTFFYRDGRLVMHRTEFPSSSLHSVSVSPDGKIFCISDWDRPLEAYAAESGERLWRSSLRRYRDVLCTDTHWLTIHEDRELVQLDAKSGEITARFPTRMRNTALYDFSPHFCLVPLRRKDWGILHKDTLEVAQTIPNTCLPEGILQDIWLRGDHPIVLCQSISGEERQNFITETEYPLCAQICADYNADEENARSTYLHAVLRDKPRIKAQVGLRG